MKRWLVIVMFLPFLSFSQQKEGKAVFHSIVSGGAMIGESTTKAYGSLSMGVKFSDFYGGIGFGYDAYRFNSWPLFADLRYNFLGKKKLLFVYGNFGVGIPGNFKKQEIDKYEDERMRWGLFTDAGIGYKFLQSARHALHVSVGHSVKEVVKIEEFQYPCGIVPCNPMTYHYKYKYNFYRIAFKAAWEFW